MAGDQRRYMSYLLRLWQAKEEGGLIWRASIQRPRSVEQAGFRSLDALFAFLRRETDVSPDADAATAETARGAHQARFDSD
jgi:hypothetical protein